MAANSLLIPVSESGWRRGFNSFFGNELARWFRTRTWWIQCLIWVCLTALLIGPYAFGGFTRRGSNIVYDAISQFSPTIPLFQSLIIISLLQGVLVTEKKDGTAAWVLSKPATRTSYVLARLAASTLGVVVTITAVSCLTLFLMVLIGKEYILDPVTLLAAQGVTLLHNMFFITLMFMLGALFQSRGPVVGIPLFLLLAQFLLVDKVPDLRYLLPCNLIVDMGRSPSVFNAIMMDYQVEGHTPMILTLTAVCILFTLVAIWRFNRQEL